MLNSIKFRAIYCDISCSRLSTHELGEGTARHEEKIPNKGCEQVKKKRGGREQYQHCEKREREREVCFGLHHHFLSALTWGLITPASVSHSFSRILSPLLSRSLSLFETFFHPLDEGLVWGRGRTHTQEERDSISCWQQ